MDLGRIFIQRPVGAVHFLQQLLDAMEVKFSALDDHRHVRLVVLRDRHKCEGEPLCVGGPSRMIRADQFAAAFDVFPGDKIAEAEHCPPQRLRASSSLTLYPAADSS